MVGGGDDEEATARDDSVHQGQQLGGQTVGGGGGGRRGGGRRAMGAQDVHLIDEQHGALLLRTARGLSEHRPQLLLPLSCHPHPHVRPVQREQAKGEVSADSAHGVGLPNAWRAVQQKTLRWGNIEMSEQLGVVEG